jgi:hypothetical protein
MEPYRVRTSYERTVAHRTRPPFAYCAEQDGVIESIDDKAKILVVKYKNGNKTAVQFGDQFTNNGGGGFYCTQNVVINNFKVGDKVKRGDVIVYNEHFFTPDPFNKQVDWNMGVSANVACIETNDTLDDGNAISKSLADKLEFNPVHVRDVVLKKTTTVHKYASVGTFVNNTDPLLIFDQSEMTDDMFGKLDEEGVELLSKLNRQTPKAKHTGRVVKIDAFYKCPIDEMADGLKGIVAEAAGCKNLYVFCKISRIVVENSVRFTFRVDVYGIVRRSGEGNLCPFNALNGCRQIDPFQVVAFIERIGGYYPVALVEGNAFNGEIVKHISKIIYRAA